VNRVLVRYAISISRRTKENPDQKEQILQDERNKIQEVIRKRTRGTLKQSIELI